MAERPLNVRQIVAEILHIDARIDAWKARRQELRGRLETEAFSRFEADGAAPTWRIPALGTAGLAAADSDPDVTVTDDAAYSEWVLNNHPTEADVVLRIPGPLAEGDQIRETVAVLASIGVSVDIEPNGSILGALIAKGRADVESGQLWAQSGEMVPGVSVTAKKPYLTVRLNAEAKARARAVLADVLATPGDDVDPDLEPLELEQPSEQTPDPNPEGEGEGDAPPPDHDPAEEGPERTSTIEVGDPEAAR